MLLFLLLCIKGFHEGFEVIIICHYMKLDNTLFDEIQKQAESSPRLRMHYDLRTQCGPDTQALGWTDYS